MAENLKSDVAAKEAFRDELLRRGFDAARITGSPADITATKGGETFYFEVKFTRQSASYFGAATLTGGTLLSRARSGSPSSWHSYVTTAGRFMNTRRMSSRR